jgi:5-methylcytosine-specific restriction endonuclease McrA
MWTLQSPQLDLKGLSCLSPETVHETDRHKSALYLERRKQRLREQTPALTELEQQQIRQIYKERDRLNQAAGFICYHVDHIAPLARGGQHHPSNLQVINASDNVRKGARVTLSTSPQKPDMVHS